uniref:Uncharacterized protein n=1 Tax=Ditylenchus dipsaci TaxID=166011 RepID=A0A915EHQ5_9BILA
MPYLSLNRTAVNDLISFALAGAGFHNFDAHIQFWSVQQVDQLAQWFKRWRGQRTLRQFLHYLFETNGYTCQDACFYGRRPIICCDHFAPAYFDPDEAGKLSLFMKQLKSPFVNIHGLQPQVVVYIGDEYEDIPTFPRFYLNDHTWYKFRIRKRRIKMLTPNPHCSSDFLKMGRGKCLVETWLKWVTAQ